MEAAFQHCEQRVRDADKDRFLATLFAPAARRPALFALYAFDLEVCHIRDRISGPLPGEVRLQYWHDLLSGPGRDDAAANPLAAALMDTVEHCALPVSSLLALLEAHRFDLYDTPMASLDALEDYARASAGTIIALAHIILSGGRHPGAEAAARAAGMAAGIAAVLRLLPVHAARGQCYLPGDLLARHGVEVDEVLAGHRSEGLRDALAELRQAVRRHLASLKAALDAVPNAGLPAFLPLALLPQTLQRMERPGDDPFQPPVIPQWRRQWTLWRASRQLRRHIGQH